MTFALLARRAGPSAFGAYAQVLGFGMLLGAALGFGHHTRILRLGAGQDARSFAFTAYLIRWSTALLISGSLLAFSLHERSAVRPSITAAALALAAELPSQFLQTMLNGRSRVRAASMVIVLHRVLLLGGLLAIPLSPMEAYAGACLLAMLLVACLSVLVSARPASLGTALRGNAGYWFATMAPNISQLESLAVGSRAGATVAGWYSSAGKVAGPLNIVTDAMVNVFVPRLARETSAGRRIGEYRRQWALARLMAAAVALASPLVAFAARAFLGPAYAGVEVIVVGVCLAAGLSGLNRSLQSLLFAQDRPKIAALATLAGASTSLALLLALAPTGKLGLALAPVIGQSLILYLLLRTTRSARKSPDVAPIDNTPTFENS